MTTLNPPQTEINSVIALYSNGRIQEALDAIKTLTKSYPNNPVLYNISGACYANLGQLDTAVKNYEKTLTIKPNYAEAHNNLGGTLQELGQLDAAVKSYKKALAIKPDFIEAHNNLGNAFKKLGQLDAAVKSYEKALTIKPDFAEAFNNLCSALKELDQLDTTVKSYQQVLSINPDYAEAHNNLGIARKELDQHDAAVKCFEKALVIKPDFVEVHYNLGVTLQELDQHVAAVKCFEQALAINPNYTEAHNHLGNVLNDLGQHDAAVKSYEKTLTLKPDYAEVHNNLGLTLMELGQLNDAIKCYEKSLTLKPNYAEAHNNLGLALMELGQIDVSIRSFDKALAIKPDYAGAHNNLGLALMELGQLDVSIRSFDKALAIKPDFAEANSNHGILMAVLKRMDEALQSFERALDLNPELNFLLGNLLHTKMHLCDWNDLSSQLDELQNKINNNEKVMEPFSMLGLIDDPEIQRKTAEIFANKNYPKNHDLPRIGLYPKHKKIRIGYFSADFREHPVSALTAELYEIHDRSHFEIYGFSYGPDTNDEMNLRIKVGVDYFHEVRTMSNKDVAILARSLEIDIAVDLGGFTQDARTGIFAMCAAPIQVSYIGYIGTMGADYYDYLLADQIMIPEQKQQYYSEKIVYLPSFQVNDSTQSPPSTSLTRQDVELPETGFVFCCFNHNFKITPTTFDSWGRILEKVKDSVLLIYADNESAQINLTKEITLRGIDPRRLIFGKRLSKPKYLARYRVADLFLDTHPYNAGATASDALRMGLPVLTYLGSSAVSRHAASIITALNLPELITTTEEEYEKVAVELATDPEKLKLIKDKLVSNLSIAPLYDTPMFTRHLESAYNMMYDRYQQGLDSDHIYVKH
jgi:protein O-GlcNAc transferase